MKAHIAYVYIRLDTGLTSKPLFRIMVYDENVMFDCDR